MSSPDLSPDTSLNPPEPGRTVIIVVEITLLKSKEIWRIFSNITPIPIILGYDDVDEKNTSTDG